MAGRHGSVLNRLRGAVTARTGLHLTDQLSAVLTVGTRLVVDLAGVTTGSGPGRSP